MTPEERQTLRLAAEHAVRITRERSSPSKIRDERWELQTSNSFRRIGCHGDADVLCGTNQRDGHPDLLASAAVLDYIVAAQPRTVISLLDQIDALEARLKEVERTGR